MAITPLTPEELTLDAIFGEIGYLRIKGEDDDAFKRRVEVHLDHSRWMNMAVKAQRRLEEILDGTGIEADATEMAAIRTILERAGGEPTKRVELTGKDGQALFEAPVTDDQIARFIKRHAPKLRQIVDGGP